MSRTYRKNLGRPLDYCLDNSHPVVGGYRWDLQWIPVSAGGWKEAKRVLSKVEYGRLRAKTGDKLTKDYLYGSIPRMWRKWGQSTHRQHTARELRRYWLNPEYEVLVEKKSIDAGGFCW